MTAQMCQICGHILGMLPATMPVPHHGYGLPLVGAGEVGIEDYWP